MCTFNEPNVTQEVRESFGRFKHKFFWKVVYLNTCDKDLSYCSIWHEYKWKFGNNKTYCSNGGFHVYLTREQARKHCRECSYKVIKVLCHIDDLMYAGRASIYQDYDCKAAVFKKVKFLQNNHK